jgi:hypothetical protein
MWSTRDDITSSGSCINSITPWWQKSSVVLLVERAFGIAEDA